ncbi:MAG: patatin-like phospholipase family protein, partial [Steroidobacteraceae bacterium]|nr:patatin-like phospholipase family protein [Steroidobacteraceae bacterium]
MLSGGGARGAAHVGVLKALHELNVPIDLIVGTSMGAVVGGLYAAGLSPEQIEATLTTVDWQQAFRDRPARQDLVFRRKREDQNFLVRFPLGLSRGRFKLPRGLIQGQKLTQILRSLTLPVADVHDFDRFPTAFRAVATDLETGEQRVLASGDLTTAMRASLAAPGIFTPVEIDGRLLVDGGLSANLPIDVARAAGAERLIVVDVGFPLQTRRNLDSVASISNQMLAILIRRNSEMQRAQLTAADILITPPLGEASSFDFSNVRRSIEAGLSGARAQSVALQRFALPPAAYERWAAARNAPRGALPPIEFVRISSDSQRYAAALQAAFGDVVGRAPDASELATRVTRFYGRGDLDSLDYRWVRDDGRGGLELRAGRNPIGPNYVRFGLNLQDDFEGNSSFNAAARFVQTELTARGAEWTWDLQVGEEPNIATEYYLPIDASQRYFVMPRARFAVRTVPLLDDQRVLAEYRVRTTEFGLDIGREFGNWGELRFGTHWAQGSARLQIGAIGLPSPRFDVQQWFARFSYDRLDDVNFPRYGQSFTA